MNLKTKARVRRSHWVRMKTSQLIIDIMTHFEDKQYIVLPEEIRQEAERQEAEAAVIPPSTIESVPDQVVVETAETVQVEEVPPEPSITEPEATAGESGESKEEEKTEGAEPVSSRTRQRTGILKSSKYSMATKVDKRTADAEKKDAIEKADTDEISLVFEELKAAQPVYEDEVEGKAHGCHMFTVDKCLASGDFDKVLPYCCSSFYFRLLSSCSSQWNYRSCKNRRQECFYTDADGRTTGLHALWS